VPTTPTAVQDEVFTSLKLSAAGVDLYWPNVTQNQQQLPDPNKDHLRTWAEIIWLQSSSQQRSFGTAGKRRYETVGILLLKVRGPIGHGIGAISTLCTSLIDLFRGKRLPLTSAVFRSGVEKQVGRDGPWNRSDVLVEFSFDEYK
jgi:hypothetical protein